MTDDAPDLFGHKPAQGELFAGVEPPRPQWKVEVDPEMIRRRLHKMLAEARAAKDESPWPYETMRVNRTIFPQMANWLPDDEADQLRRAFAAELKRLNLAA